MDKRKISILKYNRAAGKTFYERVPNGEGVFCAWGVGYAEIGENAGNFSTAIIERSDGSVENVPVELIVFQ